MRAGAADSVLIQQNVFVHGIRKRDPNLAGISDDGIADDAARAVSYDTGGGIRYRVASDRRILGDGNAQPPL